MRLVTLLTATALTFTACKKKEEEPAAKPEKPQITAQIPHETEAKKLAEKLVKRGLSNVTPTGSSDFTMDFVFKADGKWSANGQASLGGETLECEETGDWKIAEMNGEKGIVEWTIVRTNCPNRSSGDSQRALVGFESGEPSISFR